MNDYMDDFVEKFSALGEGEESLRSLQHAIAVERETLTRVAKPRGSARREAAPSARFAIIAACAIVIVLLGAFALPRLFVPHTNPNTGDGTTSLQTDFVLAAYAKGTPVEGRENTIFATEDVFSEGGVYSENDDGSFIKQYIIDPSCTGDGIVSMRYRSTNENALLEGSRDRANVLPGQSPGTPMLSEITVGGENATLPDLYQLNLCVTAVAEGEDGGAVQLEASDTPEAWDRKRCLIELAAAQELAKGTPEVTATFEDGNTVTRVYRIVPVDDFEEAWLSNNRAWDKALESGTPEYDLKPLYMLEQVR